MTIRGAGTIEVRAAAVRVRGKRLVVKATKTDAGHRTLVLPRWCTRMLRERARRLQPRGAEPGSRPVFPAPLGGRRDPSNTQADARDAFAAAGFGWVPTHAFRKTVLTVMDHAGLSSRAAADQLGHANTSMTTDVYLEAAARSRVMGRRPTGGGGLRSPGLSSAARCRPGDGNLLLRRAPLGP